MLMYYCVCVPGVYIAYIQVRAVRSREEKGKEFLETSAKETHTFLEPEPGEKESSRHSQGETLMHRYTRVFWQARPWLSNIRLVSHSWISRCTLFFSFEIVSFRIVSTQVSGIVTRLLSIFIDFLLNYRCVAGSPLVATFLTSNWEITRSRNT